MKRQRLLLRVLLFTVWFAPMGVAWSADDWYWKASGQLLLKGYQGSEQLAAFSGFAGFIAADYLERGGLKFGYHVARTAYRSGLGAAPQDVNGQIFYGSGHLNYFPDQLPGQLSVRLDAYLGRDDWQYETVTATPGPMGGGSQRKTFTENDDYQALNPIVSFLNFSKTFYADLGYAVSSYHFSDSSVDNIHITQWAPTLGFGFNRNFDWLQLRAFLIELSSSNRIADTDSTSALELKWLHWFGPDAPLAMHGVHLSLLSGQRAYAVDSDACALCNTADLQTGLITVGAEWQLEQQFTVLLQAGQESYENTLLNDDYQSTYLYMSISHTW